MNKTWYFYDADGNFTGRTFSGPDRYVEANTPEGYVRSLEPPVNGRMPDSESTLEN